MAVPSRKPPGAVHNDPAALGAQESLRNNGSVKARMTEAGRSRRFALQIERPLSEPLPTSPPCQRKRRYVPIAVMRSIRDNPLFLLENT